MLAKAFVYSMAIMFVEELHSQSLPNMVAHGDAEVSPRGCGQT